MQVTFGADIEFFVGKWKMWNFHPVPCPDWVKGTKKRPIQFKGAPSGYKYQRDGAAIEVNIPVCADANEFLYCVNRVKDLLVNLVHSHGLELHDRAVADYTNLMPEFTADNYPEAFKIGCDPDYDAWRMIKRPPFDVAQFGNSRFAGGHIHVGYDRAFLKPYIVVRLMDALFHKHQPNIFHLTKERSKFYGYPGLFRVKPYGIEYRSLCSRWTSGHHNTILQVLQEVQSLLITKDSLKILSIVEEYEQRINEHRTKLMGAA